MVRCILRKNNSDAIRKIMHINVQEWMEEEN